MIYKLIKKFHKSIFMLLLMFVGIISCVDDGYDEFVPPTGNDNNIQPSTLFTSTTGADDNLAIIFRSYSTDAASYLWDFGDGNTSTEANPDYTYANGGLYTVKLTTKSSDGLVAVDSSDVAPIFVDFNFTSIDSQVTFENLTNGADKLTWSFGDDTTLNWESEDTQIDPNFSPIHGYTTAETFDVTLTATTFLGKQVSVTKKIEGLVLSTVPEFTFKVSSLTATFTDASTLAASHSWEFGDGTTSTEVNPVHTYAVDGSYDVTLTTTNDAGVSRSITKGVPVGGVKATFAAVILNGTIDEWEPGVYNKDDNNDAWELTPPSKFKNGQTSPYRFDATNNPTGWNNSVLAESASSKLKSAGITTSENSGTHALKFSGPERRAYQPFAVEVGVEYTVTMFIRKETEDNFTVYILNNEVSDESNLEANEDAHIDIIDGTNKYIEYSFTFTATSNTAVFYAKPFSGISGSSEVYLDDITIATPGF